MDLNTKLHQSKKIHWNWKNKGYPNTIDKENTRGQGPKTKKTKQKKESICFRMQSTYMPIRGLEEKELY